MNKTMFFQMYDRLLQGCFTNRPLRQQLTLMVRSHVREVSALQRPDMDWEGATRYFIQKKDGFAFIAYHDSSKKWGPVRQNRVIPVWDDEGLFQVLADPTNLVVIPFFDVVHLIVFVLFAT